MRSFAFSLFPDGGPHTFWTRTFLIDVVPNSTHPRNPPRFTCLTYAAGDNSNAPKPARSNVNTASEPSTSASIPTGFRVRFATRGFDPDHHTPPRTHDPNHMTIYRPCPSPYANPKAENKRGAAELLLRCGSTLTHLPTEFGLQGSAAPYLMSLPNPVVW